MYIGHKAWGCGTEENYKLARKNKALAIHTAFLVVVVDGLLRSWEKLKVEEKGGYHESSACHSCFAMDYHHILKVPFQP
jgi:hypothetical protein